jgi:hypothetical protein
MTCESWHLHRMTDQSILALMGIPGRIQPILKFVADHPFVTSASDHCETLPLSPLSGSSHFDIYWKPTATGQAR